MNKKTAPANKRRVVASKVAGRVITHTASSAEESRIASLYDMSRAEAARRVKRAGIVTEAGNLATLFR